MAEPPEGMTAGDYITYVEGLDPSTQALVKKALIEADPENATLGQILPKPEDVLSAEHLTVYRQMVKHRLPGREGVVLAEMVRLHDHKLARDLAAEVELPSAEVASRLVDGGAFILDIPDDLPAIWGKGNAVVWAEGESLMLSGPPGVGKTTLAGQVVRARLIGGCVLGMPVTQTQSRVLYLAMDRPKQIARALRRTLADVDRDILDERFVPWEGPPPKDFAKHPEALLELARQLYADTVVVDSLKDAAIGLTEDEVGAGYNRARQHCLASGVEVLELHHPVKNSAGSGKAPTDLADVYGSAWLTAGAGSVVGLHGAAGDLVVQWRHLKQPAEEVGPFQVAHDHIAGTSSILDSVDLLAVARAQTDGLTAKQAAVLVFTTDKPTASQVQKARRRLDAMVTSGLLVRRDGDDATQRATRWVAADNPADDFGALL